MPSTCNFLQWQNLALQLFQSPFHCCFYYFPPLLSDLWTWSTVKALATALHKRNVLAVQEEGRGATRELQEPKQQETTRCRHLWTLNVRQDREIKPHCKANSEKEIFGVFFPPCHVHHLLKATSTEIKKLAWQVSAMHLLDCVFCLFFLQTTMTSLQGLPGPWSHLISHCKAPVGYQALCRTRNSDRPHQSHFCPCEQRLEIISCDLLQHCLGYKDLIV